MDRRFLSPGSTTQVCSGPKSLLFHFLNLFFFNIKDLENFLFFRSSVKEGYSIMQNIFTVKSGTIQKDIILV